MDPFAPAFAGSLALAWIVAQAVRRDWLEVHEQDRAAASRGLTLWTARGLVGPMVGVAVWNVLALAGPPWGLEPLAPQAVGTGRVWSFFMGTAAACYLTAMAWTVVSEAWLLPVLSGRIRRRRDFWQNAAVLGGPVLPLAGFLAYRSWWALMVAVLAGGLWLVVRAALPLVHRPQISYSRAIAKMKSGDYAVAEQEVLLQLDEKQDDFAGWMMLAELYARNFGQLAEADRTVRELCLDPQTKPVEVSSACNRLANWHLDLGSDPAAARRALQEVVRILPGTPFARSAEARIRQLPIDVAELEERRQPRSIRLPALGDAPVQGMAPKAGHAEVSARRAEAKNLRARLEARPEDLATRLRLARLLAEQLGDMDGALVQLRLLREAPDVTTAQRAEWLALEAAWALKLRRDEPAARRLLGQLAMEHPGTPQAIAARRQLELLDRPEESADGTPKPPPRIVVRVSEAWTASAATPRPTTSA